MQLQWKVYFSKQSLIVQVLVILQTAIPVVEVEESLGRIDTQAGSHILIVGQCGTEA